MVFLGFGFTIVDYLCYCISRFGKDKKNMLMLDIVSKLFTIAGLYCLGSLTGAYNMAISFALLLVANIKERSKKDINKQLNVILYIIFQSLFIISFVMTYNGISSILVTIFSSLTLISVWWLAPQQMRIVDMVNSLFYFGFQLSIGNWTGVLECIVFLSNFFSYLKYRQEYEKSYGY